MDRIENLPEGPITGDGPVSQEFLRRGVAAFHDACRYVHQLPYGYNANRDDPMSLFAEGKGTCTTKHAVIALLAQELGLPVGKAVGIYAMTEELVTGTNRILREFRLPYVPMIHCFLQAGERRVDLTEGNRNGKNRSIEDFLYTQTVQPAIRERDEYLLYRRALEDLILRREEMRGIDLLTVLRAREQSLKLLRRNIGAP